MSSLIELQHIHKFYQVSNKSFHALKGINFKLEYGEMTAIVGVSGSGKSTLMNIIGLLDRITSGHYFFSGKNVSDLAAIELARIRNEKIGFIFQSFFLLPRATALQNVMLPLFYRDTKPELAKEKAMAVMAKMGVEKFAMHKPQQLSGGQQQRIALARALVGDPEIILADEPTGALDSSTGNEVMELFIHLNRKDNRTIIIITHDKEISRRCRRIVTMKDGYLVE